MKGLLIAVLAALGLAIGSFAFFNGYIYPPAGLEHLSKDQYAQAWEIAAKGFCASSDLSYVRPDFLKHRVVEAGDEAYSWGVVRCLNREGRERLVWIYMEWSTKRHLWTRNHSLVLADDDDEVYYTPTFPGQYRRAATALSKIMKENARHVREYVSLKTP